jgi:murein DD-endopeptidase MepM/ murein hydrolase activator NlpD
MSRLAKGLVALCILLVVGATTGIQPASAGLLGPLGPKDAPPQQPPTTQPTPQQPKPTPSTTTSKPTTKSTAPAAPAAAPKLARTGPVTPPNSTAALLAALQPLATLGMSMSDIASIGFGQFPVGGSAEFRDTWMAPRESPYLHWHKGTDIFAPAGSIVRATADGVVEHKRAGAGGNAIWLHAFDGTDYYYAHLGSFVSLPSGNRVHAGDALGTVGTSGNAEADFPHTHFEVHPGRGTPVNPKPILDAWLRAALANAPAVVAAHTPGPAAHAPIVMTADDYAKALLRPLTPPALFDVLQLR